MQIYNTSNSSSYFFPIIEPVLLTQPSVPVIPPPIPAHVAEESFIVQSLGGGRYDDLLQEIVPNNPLLISSKFNLVRELFIL